MSFLRDYETFTKGNEAHSMYHLWCSLVALSSLVSRRVWVEMGYFNVYPNLYVVLDGPPGDRKTTAMSVCKRLLREVGDVPLSAESQTKESLVKELATYEREFIYDANQPAIKYTPITICVTELSQFLGISSSHMIDFLTTIYDELIYANKTKNKGSEIIHGPYVVLLGCTTPAWITARLRDDVISGGFSRRAIFVYWPGERRRIAFPEITAEADTAWKKVVDASRALLHIGGPFTWEQKARDYFQAWYEPQSRHLDPTAGSLVIPNDSILSGYYESKCIQLIKISMLVALSESHELVLRKHHLELSMELLNECEKNMSKVFEGIGRNELNAVAAKFLQLIESAGGEIPEKKLYAALHREASSDELFKIQIHLIRTDQLVKIERKDATTGVMQLVILRTMRKHLDLASQPKKPNEPTTT